MSERRAWIVDGIVTEVLTAPDGFSFEDFYPPAIVASSVPCGFDVETGWLYDGKRFLPPSHARRDEDHAESASRSQIRERLDVIDKRSVRAQRAILTGKASESDHTELVSLEKEATELRERLKNMK